MSRATEGGRGRCFLAPQTRTSLSYSSATTGHLTGKKVTASKWYLVGVASFTVVVRWNQPEDLLIDGQIKKIRNLPN